MERARQELTLRFELKRAPVNNPRTSRRSNLRQIEKWRHSRGVQSRWLFLGAWLVSCGGSAQPFVAPPAKPMPTAVVPAPAPRPPNTLYRDEVEQASRLGLGHLFEWVELEPSGDMDSQGRMSSFHGFQIVALRPASKWLSFDLRPAIFSRISMASRSSTIRLGLSNSKRYQRRIRFAWTSFATASPRP